MRVLLDGTLCQAYGNCLLAAPDLFRLEEGMAVVEIRAHTPEESARERVEEAVTSCPVEALRLVED